MGRYLNFCSSSVNSTFKSYCKIKYLMSILRKCPQLTEIYTPELLKCPHQHSRFTRKLLWQRGHTPYLNKTGSAFHLNAGEVKVFAHCYCTSSGRDGFKAEAPVGVLEATQDSHLSRLGGRIGQSFKLLSTHINLYFKRKHFVHPAKNATFETVQRMTRAQRPIRRVTKERHMTQSTKPTMQLSKDKETNPPLRENSSVELFHISSLARFGESYNYVAKHINSAFSRGGAKAEEQDILAKQSKSELNKRGKIENNLYEDETFLPNTRADQQRAKVQTQISNSWEDGYALFAAHINSYFGASVTDKEKLRENNKLQQSFKPIKPARPQTFEYKDGSQGLFHSSINATHFGESYFQTAHHINQYFKSEAVAEHDLDEDLTGVDRTHAISGKTKTVSLMDCLLHPSSVPDFVNSYLRPTQTAPSMASPRTRRTTKYLNIKQAEEATHNLIATLGQTSAPDVLTSSVEALNEHLIRYPSCRMVLWQKKTAVLLLQKRRTYRNHEGVQNAIREMLALVGYVDAVKGRGIRVLSIDGGGTRGVVPLQVLKVLEAQTGKKIHQLFDYICGVSTGAVLAFMLGLAHFSLRECEDMYQRFGSEVFRQNPFVGTVKMGWSHSYYNTETWEDILREKLGERLLIKTARDEKSPKVSAVSAVVNWGRSPKAFVFRNYNHTPGSLSRYAGGSGYQMWQAVRASSAAPGYFQEFTLQEDIHQDGGIILNNPCALAVHESRLLWPNQPFQCVLSLGTGRYDSVKRSTATSTSLRAKISSLICSATDTEGVHTLLDDLLAPNVYFRFNPTLSAEVSLDESRPGALDVLRQDTQEYLERNQPKLARLCLVLGAERSAVSKTVDWVSERAWGMKQRWV